MGKHSSSQRDAIEEVIRQFSDPLALFRELVQNAIDAGSQEVDVDLEWDEEHSTSVSVVRDFGEGMTREIIETQLTRLFSSHKDDDLTKIGKFGIGFVSVFALDPDFVVVDTGRDGEYWRVIFHPDRTFDLIALDHPCEGTEVRVVKSMTKDEHDSLRARVKTVLRRWCRFVPVPLRFAGDDVREEFAVNGLVQVGFEEEGTRIVASLVSSARGTAGYYNRGLTLQEATSPWQHIAFRIDSRYLEHTLTRDAVLEDDNFSRAWALVERLVEEDLAQAIFEEIRAAAHDPDRLWDYQALAGLVPALEFLDAEKTAVFPTSRGTIASASAVKRAFDARRLYVARGKSHVAHFMDPEVLILYCPKGGERLLRYLTQRWSRGERKVSGQQWLGRSSDSLAPILEDTWVQIPLVAADGTAAAKLCEAIKTITKPLGAPEHISFGHFDYAHSPMTEVRAYRDVGHDRAYRFEELRRYDPRSPADRVVLNADHDDVKLALAAAEVEPELAALALLKILLLQDSGNGSRPDLIDSAFAARLGRSA